jgi:hypothetical protein
MQGARGEHLWPGRPGVGHGVRHFGALSIELLCLTPELSQGGICLVWPGIAG